MKLVWRTRSVSEVQTTLWYSLDRAAKGLVEQDVKPNVGQSNTDMNMNMHAPKLQFTGGKRHNDKRESRQGGKQC